MERVMKRLVTWLLCAVIFFQTNVIAYSAEGRTALEQVVEEEKEWEEKHPEAVEYEQEMEEIREFDNDSGKGYCPFCGNYAVNSEKICESCGEKVNE